jgi:hypothetical protein
MVRFGSCCRALARAAALVAAVATLAPIGPRPAMAEQDTNRRHVVTFARVERLAGGLETATFVCGATGACAGEMQVDIWGRSYRYALFAEESDTRLSLFFWRRSSVVPELNHERGKPIRVAPAPDGAASRSAGLAMFLRPMWNPYSNPSGTWPDLKQRWVPLANVRVTVRPEDAAERSR